MLKEKFTLVDEITFRPVFSHFSEKLVAVRPPIFSGHKYFFAACFELFGRKNGHLATVKNSPKNSRL
jgi:hypothetical protein